MNTDSLTIRSSITSSLYKKILFRGSFFSLLGFIPLLYGSLKMDVDTLSIWGIPLFFLGTALIMFGMLPYKRVTELQKHPNEIHLVGDKSIRYDHLGKKTLTVPLSAIQSMQYLEDADLYGIKLHFKKVLKEKVIVHDPRFSMERFEKASRKRHGCDLFFPYFSKRSFNQLKYPLAEDHAS
ncbi:hypothetical protein [Waddlia chondrophila]|uniref:Uncharacterized protein n=2 Tax=Waddlia chondrophila TaxID=71667 RepID=D6YSM4_WADCW|nr:hypothetical protein [Waddlia chondrophila]ADI39069.1 hypothetical protein wcw_1728 [Waddlia chondrophila WSU 86-1044]